MPNNDAETKSNFDFLKSKIRELHIPLPNFKYFHKPSSEEEVFPNFIGREEDSEQLEEWLTNGDSGAYLVTGYRGMGKSSFVGKVLNKITRKDKNRMRAFTFFCLLFMISFISLFFTFFVDSNLPSNLYVLSDYEISFSKENIDWFLTICSWSLIFSICGIILILVCYNLKKTWHKFKRWLKNIEKTDYENHKTWFEKVFKIKDIKESKYNIIIKLNLGHETLREQDILSLIAKRIYDTYKDYLNWFNTNWIRLIGKNILLFIGAILIVCFLDYIDITTIITKVKIGKNTSSLFKVVQNLTVLLIKGNVKIITKLVLTPIFYFVVKMLYNFIVSAIPTIRKRSSRIILEQLRFLIDRIDASVTEDSGPNTGYTNPTSIFSFNFNRRKNKIYSKASTREIEDELIKILKDIQKVRSLIQMAFGLVEKILGKKIIQTPKFIIVFDELDKIDPVYNQVVKIDQDVPEFETEVDFQGSSAIRNRKQNVLKLLGNMKLFMSQVTAKFVFISGRELYDAFLADLADREFAASSIFNNVIYVDSFLESSTKQKNILTKTEEYICGYLIPEQWYIKNAQYQYYKERGKLIPQKLQKTNKEEEIEHQKLDNITYRYPNLRMYKKFLIETMINDYLIGKQIIITNKRFETYNEFEDLNKATILKEKRDYVISKSLIPAFDFVVPYQRYSYIPLEENEKNILLHEIKQTFLFIDKIIVFLNQFSFYLTHVCNGSPKKITIYFEQYIKFFIPKHPKNLFLKNEYKDIIKSRYCLSFTANDQQKIGFIYYIAYPIIEAIINKTSHFGDKMLVSISFLIDHILKHHKGGFSYENIEHTPELLEVYHIPNLRDAIDVIFSFLRQNLITDICGGVYQYKFRKFIADEIKYNSRVSEEISAIFNFTLDESLPVKRHYYKQIKDNEKKYLAVEESLRGRLAKNQYAIILASQLEVLGEIHLLDEEYNEAIQHYQNAFEIIKSELRSCGKTGDNLKDNDRLHLHVLLNHTVLKLGLAKEFKGAYNEAFVFYNTLLDYLVKFRYLDEKELGLGYFYEDNPLKENTEGEWKTKKIKFYHDIDGDTETRWNYHWKDKFYAAEVLPFYREMTIIKNKKIDFLFDGDYNLSGLSKILSPEKQEIISRITLFTEVKFIYQVILANLFVIEKIDLNGITQENLDLAEDQFKYMYLLTDSKDKFIQAADFYKKLASILFLKNYSNPKDDEYLQMRGFDIYETINEFCFINSDKYAKMIAGKFPKEILKGFFIDNSNNLWIIYQSTVENEKIWEKVNEYIRKYISDFEKNNPKKKVTPLEKRTIESLILRFYRFGLRKRKKYFKDGELEKCHNCYNHCTNRDKNHPCYACNYVSKSLSIFKRVFEPKVSAYIKSKSLNKIPANGYNKRKSYFFKFLEYFKETQTNSNYFFVLASALRIKADVTLSCVSENDNKLDKENFLKPFLRFLEKYYDYQHGNKNPNVIDDFLEIIDKEKNYKLSKLEKTILYYWLSSEYFFKNTSPLDSSECLTKILIIFDKHLAIAKNPFSNEILLFEEIRNTIVRKVLRNNNITNDNVNYIDLQNLKYILRNRPTMHINLSNLSTTASIEEVLFAYCKLELDSIDIKDGVDTVYFDCYQSTLLSQNRLSSTIQGKILSLEFKAKMNMAIFESIFKKVTHGQELNFHAFDFQMLYVSFLTDYFKNEQNIATDETISKLLKIKNQGNNIDVLCFLITDSLYCLTQIIEILSSNKFSNFSHSFIGDIYHQISKWATLYQLTYHILPQYSDNKKERKVFIDKGINTMKKRRKYIIGDIVTSVEIYINRFERIVNELYDNIRKKTSTTNKVFETNILNDIGTGNRHFLVPNYSIAMTLRHYSKATEVHSEGKEYKEMIKKMYIINDDISNGMHNFSLALERYSMNCRLIESKIEFLRKYYKDSLSYPLENYLKYPSESI